MPLTPELLRADLALDQLQRQLDATRHLNPVDEVEARARFLRGAPALFRYLPLPGADRLLTACDAVRPPLDHPLGREVAAATEEVRLAVLALRDRTAAAFDALNAGSGWYDEAGPPPVTTPPVRHPDDRVVPIGEVVAAFRRALVERKAQGWRVEVDPVMSARVVVDPPRSLIRVNPRATVSETDLRALVAHEVHVHVARAEAGGRQRLRLFRNGLARSLATEEGLALHAEAAAAGLPEGASDRLALLAAAARRARDQGFTGLYRGLEPLVGANGAWTTCLRLKRGLADPEAPGVYAKDRVYWIGWCSVSCWLEAGNDPSPLWVGKVGLHHPVAAWQAAGWVNPPG